MATPLVLQKNKNSSKKAKFMKMSGWIFFIIIIKLIFYLDFFFKRGYSDDLFYNKRREKRKKGCLHEITDVQRNGGFWMLKRKFEAW